MQCCKTNCSKIYYFQIVTKINLKAQGLKAPAIERLDVVRARYRYLGRETRICYSKKISPLPCEFQKVRGETGMQ